MTQAEKARALRALHVPGRPVVFANCWDAVSARMLASLGLAAVATSSAAIANSLGYRDGERISKAEMLEAVGRICRAVEVPVTADMEGGYGSSPAAEVIAAGAVGCNLEDSADDETRLVEIGMQVEKIAQARAAADQAGVPLVINARTDAFFLRGGQPAGYDAMAEAMARARAYRAAGADCIFVPGVRDLGVIRELLQASPGAWNVLAGPGAPSVGELAAAGVARVSLGSGPHRAAMGWFRRVAVEARDRGTYTALAEVAPSYDEVNGLMGE